MTRRLAAAWRRWRQPFVGTAAAAIAYRALFSIAPLAVLAIAALGQVVGADAAAVEVRALAADALGMPLGGPLSDAVDGLSASLVHPAQRWPATLVALALLLAGASGVFGEVRQAIHRVYGVAPVTGRHGWRADLAARLAGLALVLGGGVLFGLTIVTAQWVTLGAARLGLPVGWLPAAGPAQRAAIIGLTVLWFAALYHGFPDVRLPWSRVWGGALLAAALFNVGKRAFAAYVGLAGTGSLYGAAGTVVVFVLWVYVSASVLLFGAAWVAEGGSAPPPDEADRPARPAGAGGDRGGRATSDRSSPSTARRTGDRPRPARS